MGRSYDLGDRADRGHILEAALAPDPEQGLPQDSPGGPPQADPPSPPQTEFMILRQAVENVPEAFVTIDEDHHVVLFNAAAERLFGFRRGEVLGRDLNLILSPSCSRDHRLAVSRYLASGRGRRIGHETELVVTRRDGTRIPVSISFSVSRAGGKRHFTGIMRDLTEDRSLREQAARSKALADLGRLVAEINHEIRNPLMIIGINVHQLLEHPETGSQPARLKAIEAEVQRLENLLKELNEYYRVRQVSLEAFDVQPVLEEVCLLVRPQCEQRGVILDCRIGTGPVWVQGDRNGLREVLFNIIENALDVLDEGGHLLIESDATDRFEVVIADDGPGIPLANQAKIFTPFFTTKTRGSGLGLATSKRIMDAHPGGRLEFMSQEAGGTVFKISLPRVSPPDDLELKSGL